MSVFTEAVAIGRKTAGEAVMSTLAADGFDPAVMARADDLGLFGPKSIVWRVNGDPASIIGGFRALLLQALHVRAMALFDEYTDMYTDSIARLGRTIQFVVGVTYGSTDHANNQIAAVNAIHARVTGVDAHGNPIAADDPDLVTWVHITLVDSWLTSFEKYGAGKLTDAEKDQYVAEMAVIGERLGGTDVPRTVTELAESLESYRPEFGSNREGRANVRFLLTVPGLNPIERAGHLMVMAAAIGSLPGHARRILRLPLLPLAEPLAIRPAAAAMIRTLGWLMEGVHRENPLILAD